MSEVLPEGGRKKKAATSLSRFYGRTPHYNAFKKLSSDSGVCSLQSEQGCLISSAPDLTSCKIKARLCRWIWEDGNFHVCHNTLLRGNYGVDCIWKELKTLGSMHTYLLLSCWYFKVIQYLASAPWYFCWQHKQVFKCYFKLKGGEKEKRKEGGKDETKRSLQLVFLFVSM